VIVLFPPDDVEFATPDDTTFTAARPTSAGIRLTLAPHTVTVLAATADGPVPAAEFGTAELRATVDRLVRDGWLHLVCCDGVGTELLVVRLVGPEVRYDFDAGPGEPPFQLSRAAVLRRTVAGQVLAAPGVELAVRDRRVAAILAELRQPRTLPEVAKTLPELPEPLIAAVVRTLFGAGVVTEPSPRTESCPGEDPS
jgi:hypothetical protein